MTHLLNHARLKEHLSGEILRAEREGLQLSFAMIDIDHFKKVNDTYGHPVGDSVIRSLAHSLREMVRPEDVIGRYGGEEFGCICPGLPVERARQLFENIRAKFSTKPHKANDTEFPVTFSCGIAGFPDCTDTASITAQADRALYEAKRSGRNRVMIARTELG